MEQLTHWKQYMNPDYLGAYALKPGEDLIATIDYVGNEEVTGTDGKKDMCFVVHFIEQVKPMVLNVTNSKTISNLFKTPYVERWHGKKIQIYSEKVKAFGEVWDALRIRPFIPVEAAPKCADCGSNITDYGTFKAVTLAAYTQKQYGRALCSECAQKAKEAKEAENKNVGVL